MKNTRFFDTIKINNIVKGGECVGTEERKSDSSIITIDVRDINGSLVVGSRAIAEGLKLKHKGVLMKIRKCLNKREFSSITYLDNRNREQIEYVLSKDSFILLMMNYEGRNDFKRAYIERFNQMEQRIKGKITELPLDYPSVLRELADKVEEVQRYKDERDEAVKTKGQISSSREALVLGRYGNAVKKQKKLNHKIVELEHELQVVGKEKEGLVRVYNKYAEDDGGFKIYEEVQLPSFICDTYNVYADKNMWTKPKEVQEFYKDKRLNFYGLKNIYEVMAYLDLDEDVWKAKLIESRILRDDLSPTHSAFECGLLVVVKREDAGKTKWTTRDGRLFLKWCFYGEHGDKWDDISKYTRTICKYNMYIRKLPERKEINKIRQS